MTLGREYIVTVYWYLDIILYRVYKFKLRGTFGKGIREECSCEEESCIYILLSRAAANFVSGR